MNILLLKIVKRLYKYFIIFILLTLNQSLVSENKKPNAESKIQEFIDNWTDLSYRSFTNKNGLPQNTVTAVEFDNDGYLWVGTQNGLVIYDGQSFQNIPLSSLINQEISNSILYIYNSQDNNLWIVNNEGHLLRRKNKKWEPVSVPYTFTQERIIYITEEKGDNNSFKYFMATQKKILVLDNDKWSIILDFKKTSIENKSLAIKQAISTKDHLNKITLFVLSTHNKIVFYKNNKWEELNLLGNKNIKITNIYTSDTNKDKNSLIISTDDGIFNYNINEKNLSKILNKKDIGSSSASRIWKTYSIDGTEYLWITTSPNSAFFKYNIKNNTAHRYNLGINLPKNDFRTIKIIMNDDITKEVWIGTDGGGLLQLRNNIWNELSINKKFPNLTPSIFLESFDKLGSPILWIGSLGTGLLKLHNNKIKLFDANNDDNFCNNYVLDILESFDETQKTNILWVTTSNGLVKIVNDIPTCYGRYKLKNKATDNNASWFREMIEEVSETGKKHFGLDLKKVYGKS